MKVIKYEKGFACTRCGARTIPPERYRLGYHFCKKCSSELVTPIREVQVAATSLQWI